MPVDSVSVAGTKIDTNASKRNGIRHDRAEALREQLRLETGELLGKAEPADAADVPDPSWTSCIRAMALRIRWRRRYNLNGRNSLSVEEAVHLLQLRLAQQALRLMAYCTPSQTRTCGSRPWAIGRNRARIVNRTVRLREVLGSAAVAVGQLPQQA